MYEHMPVEYIQGVLLGSPAVFSWKVINPLLHAQALVQKMGDFLDDGEINTPKYMIGRKTIDNELEDDPVTDDEQPTMANLKAAYSECNITITGFEAITLKAKPDQAEITFEN